jgi:hypothetical protein
MMTALPENSGLCRKIEYVVAPCWICRAIRASASARRGVRFSGLRRSLRTSEGGKTSTLCPRGAGHNQHERLNVPHGPPNNHGDRGCGCCDRRGGPCRLRHERGRDVQGDPRRHKGLSRHGPPLRLPLLGPSERPCLWESLSMGEAGWADSEMLFPRRDGRVSPQLAPEPDTADMAQSPTV